MPKVTHSPILSITNAGLKLGQDWIWRQLNLEVKPGEFIAVLGPNGSGKTSLLKVLLNILPLTEGNLQLLGTDQAPSRHQIGYIPQQKSFDPDLPLRGRDLVQFGLDGHRYGLGRTSTELIDQALAEVGATEYGDKPIGQLSGGQQQRLRVAQALLGSPQLLLCDEPLLSLDLSQQQIVSSLIDQRRQQTQLAVLFVTHDINPILPFVDRVLYFAHGRWATGTPDEILTSKSLSQLYQTPVEVVHIKGRILVLGGDESHHMDPEAHHPHHPPTHHHHHD